MEEVIKYLMDIYNLHGYKLTLIPKHIGGRNIVYVCEKDGENKFVLRISPLEDRILEDYLAETEFVHYLSLNGALVADVIPSINSKYVETINYGEKTLYVSMFDYAKGILIKDNDYHYRDGVSINEYFYNVGKVLGSIHKLSKKFISTFECVSYFDKYNKEYIDELIPDTYRELKNAIFGRLKQFEQLPTSNEVFGLIHFDFGDGNYHIDMNTGNITVFDFETCIYCWYLFDLANLWIQGVGWYESETDYVKRMNLLVDYFNIILEGYKSETNVCDSLLERLPLFIDMVLIENIVDDFEYSIRNNEDVDYNEIKNKAKALIEDFVYIGENIKY